MLTSYSENYKPAIFTQQTRRSNIRNQEWEIRDAALQCQRDNQHVEAAKHYIKLFDNAISIPSDLKYLKDAVYAHINYLRSPITDFTAEEVTSIISACKTAIPLNEDDKLKTQRLLNHLDSILFDINVYEENIENQPHHANIKKKPKFQIVSKESLKPKYIDISRKEPFLTLKSIGYPANFFMIESEDLSFEQKWKIRAEAIECNRKKEYVTAAKLCLKLLMNCDSIPTDSKLLTNILYDSITTLKPRIVDYNLSEIQAIVSFCNNAIMHNGMDAMRKKALTEHLDHKTNRLVETIESDTRKIKLLLKSKYDENSELNFLLPEILKNIASVYLAVIKDIGQQPVDISKIT